MFEEYRRELEQLGPSAAQLERLKRVLADPPRRRRRPVRTVLIAAAVCAALAAAALAAVPGLRAQLMDRLGDFGPYAQTVEGVSATDQGIRVQVVSALADRTEGWVYLAVTDLTGDRLDACTALDGLNYVDGGPQSYDPETRTALFCRRIDMDSRTGSGAVTLQIRRITPRVVRICPEADRVDGMVYEDPVTLPTDGISGACLRSFALTDGRTVLEPEQTPAELGSPYMSLSSMGMDEDGGFHIQVALREDVDPEQISLFVEEGSVILTSGERVEITGTQCVVFGEGRYCDITLCLPEPGQRMDPERIGEMELGGLLGVLAVGEPVLGEWTLTFDVETVPERTIQTAEMVNGMEVEVITCAVTSVTVTGTSGGGTPAGMPLGVYLADGTVVTADRGRPTELWEKKNEGRFGFSAVWRLDRPVEPGEVTALSFGHWYLPLNEDGTAGRGRWCSQPSG